jgi:hypothetical protein
MSGFLDRVAFSVGADRYHWGDVVAAAIAWGRWAALVRQSREGESLVRAAREAGALPTRAELDAEAAEFRYARELTSADATRHWLDRHDLTVERWTSALRRLLVRRRAPAPPDELPGVDALEAHVILDDAICTGALGEAARELATHVAAARQEETPDDGADAAPEAAFPALPRTGDRLSGTPLDEARLAASLARLAPVERAYQRLRARALTPERLRSQVGAKQLEWVRLDCQSLAFTDEHAAREAVLSLREDGLSAGEVAASARVRLVQSDFFLEDVPAPLRDRLLGAREGDVVGPLGANGTSTLYVVRRKTLPSPDDPVVRARAESLVMRALLGEALVRQVEWAR